MMKEQESPNRSGGNQRAMRSPSLLTSVVDCGTRSLQVESTTHLHSSEKSNRILPRVEHEREGVITARNRQDHTASTFGRENRAKKSDDDKWSIFGYRES